MSGTSPVYRFRHLWRLPASPSEVYTALERGEDYPSWWRQVREVTAVDQHTGSLRIRSLLPLELRVTVRSRSRDPEAGVLELSMAGDLDGWARWTLRGQGGGTRVLFEQCVVARTTALRVLTKLGGRPLLRANHAWMMRAGRRGLRAWLRRGGGRHGVRERRLDEG